MVAVCFASYACAVSFACKGKGKAGTSSSAAFFAYSEGKAVSGQTKEDHRLQPLAPSIILLWTAVYAPFCLHLIHCTARLIRRCCSCC
jgi:hypothetical protein